MAMTVEVSWCGYWAIRAPDSSPANSKGFLGFGVFVAPMQIYVTESAGHYGSALDHYRQEHKSSDELPSNSETVEPDGHPPSGVYGKFGVQENKI
uniref:Uncharacterized protein n=1 Tax=Oryza meridionalis TaxID=40149 RepID=A0A0E0E9C0_9ORYZ